MNQFLKAAEKRLLSVKELSHYLAMPVATIYTYVHTHRIPAAAIVRIGRALRFEKEEIDRWVNGQKPAAFSASPALSDIPRPLCR